MKIATTFDSLPKGSYFRVDTKGMDTPQAKELRKFRCRKVYENHYIQLLDDPCGLTEETLRRSYTDFKVILEEPEDGRIAN